VDRHYPLLAEAAQRLAVILGEATALLGALAMEPNKSTSYGRVIMRHY